MRLLSQGRLNRCWRSPRWGFSLALLIPVVLLLSSLGGCDWIGDRSGKASAQPYVVVSVGDINLSEDVSGLLEKHGGDYSFEHLRAHIKGDQVLGNLETVVTDVVVDPRLKKRAIHRMEPRYLETLKDEGFTILGLANNHSGDQGREGFQSQLGHLQRLGIAGVGGGRNLEEAQQAVIFEGGGLKIAVLSMQKYRKSLAKLGFFANQSEAGIWALRTKELAARVKQLRKKDGVDFVIASIHWGSNYKPETKRQKKIARKLVAAGVDLVNGHGGHIAQSIELVDGVPVLYGLGNFTFGSDGAYKRRSPDNRLSMIARYVFSAGGLARIELLPIRTDNRRVKFKPRPAGLKQAREQFEPVIGRHGLSWDRQENGWYVWSPS